MSALLVLLLAGCQAVDQEPEPPPAAAEPTSSLPEADVTTKERPEPTREERSVSTAHDDVASQTDASVQQVAMVSEPTEPRRGWC